MGGVSIFFLISAVCFISTTLSAPAPWVVLDSGKDMLAMSSEVYDTAVAAPAPEKLKTSSSSEESQEDAINQQSKSVEVKVEELFDKETTTTTTEKSDSKEEVTTTTRPTPEEDEEDSTKLYHISLAYDKEEKDDDETSTTETATVTVTTLKPKSTSEDSEDFKDFSEESTTKIPKPNPGTGVMVETGIKKEDIHLDVEPEAPTYPDDPIQNPNSIEEDYIKLQPYVVIVRKKQTVSIDKKHKNVYFSRSQ